MSRLTRRELFGGTVLGGSVGALAGCSGAVRPRSTTVPTPAPAARTTSPTGADVPVPSSSRTLLAYFSRAGENYADGGRVDLETGNTAVAARIVADLVDVDLFEIRAADPYPHDYDETVARNVREQDAEARPAIADRLPDLTRYDTVILGSGLWNVRIPRIMRTFTDAADLAGRTVLPLVTYAVSGMGRAEDEYREACPDSTVAAGVAVRGEDVSDAGPDLEAWLRGSGLLS